MGPQKRATLSLSLSLSSSDVGETHLGQVWPRGWEREEVAGLLLQSHRERAQARTPSLQQQPLFPPLVICPKKRASGTNLVDIFARYSHLKCVKMGGGGGGEWSVQ